MVVGPGGEGEGPEGFGGGGVVDGGFVVEGAEGGVGGFGFELEGVPFEDEVAEHSTEPGSVHA